VYSCTILIRSANAGTGAAIMFSPTRTGKLQGTAIAAAAFGAVLHAVPASATVSPSMLEFGDVAFGGPSKPQSVLITAPKGTAFKSIFGLQQFQVEAGGCIPFKSPECTVSVAADNSLDRVGAFGQHGGYLLVTYTSGTTDYIGVNANFLPPPLSVVLPSDNANYPYSPSKLNATDTVFFEAKGSASIAISWLVSFSYRTSGGKCRKCTFSQTFNSYSTQDIPQTYVAIGGQAMATAQQAIAGFDPKSVNFTVTGVPIPATMITNELLTRYGPRTTPRLMLGIAKKESNYLQFFKKTLYGVSAYWPTESGEDGGSHIGLMQMPVQMDVAWNWKTNVDKGVDLFLEKLSIAKTAENAIRTTHIGLRTLNGEENENMALVRYGPAGKPALDMQYYIPSCEGGTVNGSACEGGTWQWQENIANNPDGVAYAKDVREKMKLVK
jgi:hypothetical protein